MSLSFDIILYSYDAPESLDHWFHRLYLHSDYLKYAGNSQVIVADTGMPLDRIEAHLEVMRKWKSYKKAVLMRANTDAIRASVPPTEHARPIPQACNIATRDISRADVVLYTVLGFVFPPKYFSQMIPYHEQHRDIWLQPYQFRLHSSEYHRSLLDAPIDDVLASGDLKPCGGTPDFSLRREHYLAIGGMDEKIIKWGMCDIDLCSRLTGCIDFGTPAQAWCKGFTGRDPGPYQNLGLRFIRPLSPLFYSIICQDYPDHLADSDVRRQNSLRTTIPQYINQWSIIQRNQDVKPVDYLVFEDY